MTAQSAVYLVYNASTQSGCGVVAHCRAAGYSIFDMQCKAVYPHVRPRSRSRTRSRSRPLSIQ